MHLYAAILNWTFVVIFRTSQHNSSLVTHSIHLILRAARRGHPWFVVFMPHTRTVRLTQQYNLAVSFLDRADLRILASELHAAQARTIGRLMSALELLKWEPKHVNFSTTSRQVPSAVVIVVSLGWLKDITFVFVRSRASCSDLYAV